jgi:hypothetical protein
MSLRKKINKQDLKDPKALKAKTPSTSLKVINGQIISRTRQPARLNIMTGMQKLSDKNLANFTNSDSLTAEAVALLSALGASVDSTKGRDYNLTSTQTDKEIIENPNIEDKNLKNMKSTLTDAKDKFSSAQDPFYNLDEAPRQFRQIQADKAKTKKTPQRAIQRLAADIAVINNSRLYKTKLKQFS